GSERWERETREPRPMVPPVLDHPAGQDYSVLDGRDELTTPAAQRERTQPACQPGYQLRPRGLVDGDVGSCRRVAAERAQSAQEVLQRRRIRVAQLQSGQLEARRVAGVGTSAGVGAPLGAGPVAAGVGL